MLKGFGQKVRKLREEKKITREEFCGDETELSVRQLTRIEAGQSAPTLTKIQYIAERLGVTVGLLTDGKEAELPNRYKELKYLVLRTSTYMDSERLKQREEHFDEIFESFYDDLPEEEQIVIDLVQSRFDVYNSGEVDFGLGMLGEYFNQVRRKDKYNLNDIILIDLYLLCASIGDFDLSVFDEPIFDRFVDSILDAHHSLSVDELFMLINLLISMVDIEMRLNKWTKVVSLLDYCYKAMQVSQDFQKMPIYYMLSWKYALFHLQNKEEAEKHYQQSMLFANMMNDSILIAGLEREWQQDLK